MSYPFVPAWFDDLGPRKGPTLGLLYHMAEGGGTVGYLDKTGRPPSRGVSVHAVCEYSGRVVQMLPWSDASGSLNPADRSTDKGYYGHGHLVDVLGDWWRDPNSAVISMEIEGFARDGPNARQVAGAIAWGRDMRSRFAELRGAIGHADQTDTKRCPGATPPMRAIFDGVGGHGLWQVEEPMGCQFRFVERTAGVVTVKGTGRQLIRVDNAERVNVPAGQRREVAGLVVLTAPLPTGVGMGSQHWLVGNIPGADPDESIAALLPIADGTYLAPPAPDCSPIQRELDLAKTRIVRAITDLGGTPA